MKGFKDLLYAERSLLFLFVLVYLLRFAGSQQMGMMPQDAYYYLYSEYLDWSYFDHPPAVAYMLKSTSYVFGQSVGVVKATDFVVSFVGLLAFYYFSTLILSKRKAIYATVFYGVTLQLTVLSMVTTPDVPLMLFWTLSLISIFKATHGGKIYWWALAGMMIGISFLSKYTGVFLLAGLLGFLLLSKGHRHYLLSKELLILLVCALIPALPVVWWNYSNDWISFRFQSAERADDVSGFMLKPKFFFGNIGTQMLLLIPIGFVVMFVVLYKNTVKVIRDRLSGNSPVIFLLVFSLPIILLFYGVSMVYWVKLNWTMPAYIAGFVLVGMYLKRRTVLFQIGLSVLLHIALLVEVYAYVVDINSDDTWVGWEELAAEVQVLQKAHPDHFVFSSDGYKTSAVLNFYLDEHIYSGNVIGIHGLQFSLIDSSLIDLEGTNAIYIDSQKKFLKSYGAQKVLNRYFEKVKELPPIVLYDASGMPEREFAVYECFDYRLPILKQKTPKDEK